MHDVVKIIIEKRGRYLFIQRGEAETKSGYWCLPTGRVEPGESQADAVVREALEEVGLVVRPLAKVHESISADGLYRMHWWSVVVSGGVERAAAGEVAQIKWVAADQVKHLHPCFDDVLEYFAKLSRSP